MKKNLLLLSLLSLLSLPVYATSEISCPDENGTDGPIQPARLMEVTVPESYFYHYVYNHNKKSLKQDNIMLHTGDHVVAGSEQDGYRCAYYLNHQGNTTRGWIKKDALHNTHATPQPWQGRWYSDDGNAELVIRTQIARYIFSGGGNTLATDYPFIAPANSDITTLIAPEPTDTPCHLHLRRMGDYLLLTDPDMTCGYSNANPERVLIKTMQK